ncbi:MAG: hypothetical protein ACLQLG_06075 [Thermoguttaceae bacterium]
MAEAISCPHCDCQMALRAELAGQRVVCPHCKAAFVAPGAAAAEPAAAGPPSLTARAGAGSMDFLGDLRDTRPRSTGPSWSAGGNGPPPRPASLSPARKQAKKPPVEVLILGGLGAAVLVVGLIIVVVKFSGEDPKPPATTNNSVKEDIKFGLNLAQRKQLFFDLVEAVDKLGMGEPCQQRWRAIQQQYGVNNNAAAQILDEGFNSNDWRIPEYPTTQSRINFKTWNAERTKTGHYPMLGD